MTDIRPPDATRTRQRRLYDGLWRSARTDAMSADLIRFKVWQPYLKAPVVDIGAGDALLSRSHPALGVVSVDLSGVGLRQAGPRAAMGAAETLPLRDGSMCTVVLSEVLEHAERPELVLQECRRVLTGDGRLLLSTPLWPLARAEHLYHWMRTRERPRLENISCWDPNHERRYDLADLLDAVGAAGFAVEATIPLFGSGSTAAMYFVEPLVARVSGSHPRWAQHLTGVDRAVRFVDHASGAALVCRPRSASGEPRSE